MKRKSLLKLIVVVGLSLMLLAILTRITLAADAGGDFWLEYENALMVNTNTGNNTENTNVANNVQENIVDFNPLNENKVNTNENIANTNTENSLSNVANNAIPYTGIEDINPIVTLVIVIGAVVAVYSFKKYNEYQNV